MLNRKMKDSGIEWIGEIPKEWNIRKLKYILVERKEKNDPIKTNNILSLSVERGVFPYSEKTGGGNKAKEDLTAYKVAYPFDIVINSMNILAGAVGLSQYMGAVSPVYYTLFSRDDKISIEYYYYLFLTEAFQRSLLGLGNGIMMKESSTGKLNTIRMRIPMERLASLYLPIPTSENQEKIIFYIREKLVQIDSVISGTKQSIIDLKKYKQSLITETITKGLNNNIEMEASGIDWIGKIPRTWKLTKINTLFKIKKNIARELGYNVLSVTQNGLKIKNISQNEGQMSADYSKYQLVLKGQFVMNHMDLLTGWIDISKFDGVTSPDYRVFESKDSRLVHDRYFLYIFQLCYLNRIFYGLGQGVSNLGRWRLQSDKFLNFFLPLPTLGEQLKIAKFLDEKTIEIDQLISDKEQLIKEYETYKKSLIYEYVTGKKEV
ncbi:restriction endonuclease subunit S [Vagococcus sp. BWB3-3]|uniref:Restriction endonuclease subunit S n=1 Tax=Vagococcus allomyrinae TaxID=2794353 RepID=A0A940P4P3_9ENTE|nr:restriction endonuclease subunit S [Vagococcus allomyrinae]MBP1040985.1 restriction endonuclease subunit S [Vagococcus allomyrinae]